MKRLEHEINGERVVHYDGPQHSAGLSLCGHDIDGDSMGAHVQGAPPCMESWTRAEETRRRVNCQHCQALVAHVRGRKGAGGATKD